MMRRFLHLLVLWVFCIEAHARPPLGSRHWFTPHGNGNFSASAENLCGGSSSASGNVVWSPDHRRQIVARPSAEGDTSISAIDEAGRTFAIDTAGWNCPEIGWSAHSDLVFVTYSDGGAVGTYHVAVYRFSAGRISQIDLTAGVRRDFDRHYPKCAAPEEPNIAGVAWSADSSRLLVAAQVLPHSNCDDMGTFQLYAVAVANRQIIDRMPQRAAKASLYQLLGPELRAANDRCFSEAGSCRVPAVPAVPRARLARTPRH